MLLQTTLTMRVVHFNVPGPNWVVAVDEDGIAATEDGIGELSVKLTRPDAEALKLVLR